METTTANTEASQSSYDARPEEEQGGVIERIYFSMWQNVQTMVDRYAIYPRSRWLTTGLLFVVYVYRAYINQGKEKRKGVGRVPHNIVLPGTVHARQVPRLHLPQR